MRTVDDQARIERLMHLHDATGSHKLMIALGTEPAHIVKARRAAIVLLHEELAAERKAAAMV